MSKFNELYESTINESKKVKPGFYVVKKPFKLTVMAQRATWRTTIEPGTYRVDLHGKLYSVDGGGREEAVGHPTGGDRNVYLVEFDWAEVFLKNAKPSSGIVKSNVFVEIMWDEAVSEDRFSTFIDWLWEGLEEQSLTIGNDFSLSIQNQKHSGKKSKFMISIVGKDKKEAQNTVKSELENLTKNFEYSKYTVK